MSEAAPMTKGDEVAAAAIRERGYLVLGFTEDHEYLKPGYTLTRFARLDLSQPIAIYQETDHQDWMEQCRALMPIFVKDDGVPRVYRTEAGKKYFRASTD